MPVFEYKALTAGGKAVQGLREADSPKSLRATLRREGVFLTDVLGEQQVKAQQAREVNVRRWVLGRDFGPSLQHLDETLGRGIAAVRAHPMALGLPLLFVLLDWAASVLVLAVCFEALGGRPHLGVLLTGFAIGVTVGFLSMLPGGMGAQEGSMTGIYVLLGVQLEQAVLAAVLFRVVYYIVPFVASLVLYSRLLRARPESGAVSG